MQVLSLFVELFLAEEQETFPTLTLVALETNPIYSTAHMVIPSSASQVKLLE